jgi:hypothetical protein
VSEQFEEIGVLFGEGVSRSEEVFSFGGTDAGRDDLDAFEPLDSELISEGGNFFLFEFSPEGAEFDFLYDLFEGRVVWGEFVFFLIRRILFLVHRFLLIINCSKLLYYHKASV